MPQLPGYWSLLYLPFGLIGLSFMVFVHELGHFLAAKSVGVRVHTFSIGFGKKLLRWKKGDTEYCLSAIPFGGYVAMAGENPDEGGYGATDEFQQKSVGARIFIAVAGPAANIAFAIAILFGLYLVGVQEPKGAVIVGQVAGNSAAEKAGVLPGDELLSFDGKPVRSWEDFVQEAALSGSAPRPLEVARGGETKRLTLAPEMDARFGIALTGLVGTWDIGARRVLPGSPAEKAGLKTGDIIQSIDGEPVSTSIALVEMVNGSKGRPLTLGLARDGKPVTLTVTPRLDDADKRWRIGIELASIVPTHTVRRGVAESFKASLATTWGHATLIFRTLGRIFTGDVKLKALSGPLGIVQMISGTLQQGMQQFLQFTALLNTNLGVMNLLPLAITDGGLILLLLIEAIRRKPVSPKVQGAINRVGMSFFIALALFITFHDILRIPMFLN
jgi:regulator of sigma E protease